MLDLANTFSNEQAVTATALSTNVIDTGPLFTGNARNLGASDLYLLITVTEAATAAGAATVTFTLETDDNAGISSGAVLWTSTAIGKATLVAGYQIVIELPLGASYERYLAVRYTVATGPLTAGKFHTSLTRDKPVRTLYKSAVDTAF